MNRRPHTAEFQVHFRKVYRDLKQINALQIQNLVIDNTAKMDKIKTQQEKSMLQMTDALKNKIYHLINHILEEAEEVNTAPPQSANATTKASLHQEISKVREMI